MTHAATMLAVHDFLVAEAELLDHRRFDEWIELFTDDAEYYVPVRVMRKNPHSDVCDEIAHFDDNKRSLVLRVKRLGTDVAWCEDPPSLTRRFVTNFRVTPGDGDGELHVRDNLLLYRSKGGGGVHDLLSGERQHTLRPAGKSWQIAARRVVLDQASLGTKNLGIFL